MSRVQELKIALLGCAVSLKGERAMCHHVRLLICGHLVHSYGDIEVRLSGSLYKNYNLVVYHSSTKCKCCSIDFSMPG